MNSSRRKFAAILEALGVPPSARRSTASPACEPLEGRQLMATGSGLVGMGMAAMPMPGMGVADFSISTSQGAATGLGTVGGTQATSAIAFGRAGGLGRGAGQSALQPDLEQLRLDSQAIHDKSQVTPAMQHAVTADLQAIRAAVTTTPGASALAVLRTATRAAQANPGGPSLGQVFQVEVAQNVVYLSEGVPASLIDQLDADEAKIMAATGITAADEAILAADHAAIQADQAKAPAAATPTTLAATPTPAASTTAATADSPSMPTTPPAFGSFGPGTFAGQSGLSGSMDSPGMAMMADFGMSPMGGPGGSGATSAPAGRGTADAPTAAQTTLQLAVRKLQIDTQAVHDKSQVTPAMEAVVRLDLETIRGVATTPPDSAAVATLQADRKAAEANAGGPTAAQTAQVQADMDAVLKGQGVNAALVAKLDADQAAVKAASGITAADESDLAADRTAVKAATAAVMPPASTTTDASTSMTATPAGKLPGPDARLMMEGSPDLGEFGPLA